MLAHQRGNIYIFNVLLTFIIGLTRRILPILLGALGVFLKVLRRLTLGRYLVGILTLSSGYATTSHLALLWDLGRLGGRATGSRRSLCVGNVRIISR